MAAAVAARRSGAAVTVLDDNPSAGGQIWRGHERSRQAARWFGEFDSTGIALITAARVVAADPRARTVLLEKPDTAVELHYDELILACGARELFLPFPGWTLPGVFGAGGLQALVKGGMPVSGKRIVVGGSGPLLLAAAAYLRKRGGHVKLIVEQAPTSVLLRFAAQLFRSPAKVMQAAALRVAMRSATYLTGSWVEAAEGAGRLERVRIRHGEKTWTEPCDYAGIAYGLYPNTELAALLGCRITQAGIAVDDLQRASVERVLAAGECTGIGGVELSLVEGEIAGHAACGKTDQARRLFPRREKARRFARALNSAFAPRQELKRLPRSDTFICRCEDVTLARLEPYASFRAAKLHTRCGMGPCQGRICGPAAEFLFGWRPDGVRPPILPARIGTLALQPTEEATRQ